MASTGEVWRLGHRPALDGLRGRVRRGGDLRTAFFRVALPAAWVAALVMAAWATLNYVLGGWVGYDSHAYWLAGRIAHPYGAAPGTADAFLYSPVFAQAMRLFAWMPWHVFASLFATASAGAFWWLARPLSWRWRVPVLLICWTEVLTGNISAFMAVALVLAVTRGEALAFPVLTKVTPGGVGVLWHGVRGEWRQVGRAVAACAVIAGASFAVEPQLWFEWLHFLFGTHATKANADRWPRMVAALALTVYAARRNRPGLLAVAFWLAMPMGGLVYVQPMSVLVAAVRLRGVSVSPRDAVLAQTST